MMHRTLVFDPEAIQVLHTWDNGAKQGSCCRLLRIAAGDHLVPADRECAECTERDKVYRAWMIDPAVRALLRDARETVRRLAARLGVYEEDLNDQESEAFQSARDWPLQSEDIPSESLDALWNLTQLHADLNPDAEEPWL